MKRSIIKTLLKEDPNMTRKTRSQREQKSKQSNIHIINCHCCKVVDTALNMMTCSRIECRESFCLNCIKKTYVKYNPNLFLILKEKESNNNWRCYKCTQKCPCIDCEEKKDREGSVLKRKKRRRRIVRKIPPKTVISNKTQPKKKEELSVRQKLSSPSFKELQKSKTIRKLRAQNKIKKMFKFGDFSIYEVESNEEEPKNFEDKIKTKILEDMNQNTMHKLNENNFFMNSIDETQNFNKMTDMNDYVKFLNDLPNRQFFPYFNKLDKTNDNSYMNKDTQKNMIQESIPDKVIHSPTESNEKNFRILDDEIMNSLNNMEHKELKVHNECPESKLNEYEEAELILDRKFYFSMQPTYKKVFQFETSDTSTNQKLLTKPCTICNNSHFAKFEILKSLNFKDFMNTIKKFVDERNEMSDSKIEDLKKNLNMTNYTRDDSNFIENRILFESCYKSFENNEEKETTIFRRAKRICMKCIYTKLEEPNGMVTLLDSAREEDEQACLDPQKKEEIIKSIQKNMIDVNGYYIMNLTTNPNSTGLNNININQRNDEFNIFNNIFDKKKGCEKDSKYLQYFIDNNKNIKSIIDKNLNPIVAKKNFDPFDSNQLLIFRTDNVANTQRKDDYSKGRNQYEINETLNLNLNFLNDQKLKTNSPAFFSTNLNHIPINNQPEELISKIGNMLDFFQNQIAFNISFSNFQQSMINTLLSISEHYNSKISYIMEQKEIISDTVLNQLQYLQVDQNASENEKEAINQLVEKYKNNNQSFKSLVNIFKSSISQLKLQSENLNSNLIISPHGVNGEK